MNSLDTEFHRRLLKRVSEEFESKAGNVLSGLLDEGSYKRETGYLRALTEVKDWCAEIEDNMKEGK